MNETPLLQRTAAYREIFSTVHHMERIGLLLATRYGEQARDAEEQAFAAAQRKEEGRHVSVCRRIAAAQGGLLPPSRYLRWMERLLVKNPILEVQLLGLLGGDIMGEFLLRRLLATDLPADERQALEEVLADEERHIVFLRDRLASELSGPSRRVGHRVIGLLTQVGLLVADLLETARLKASFRAIGLDPRVESVMCYLHYREQTKPLAERPGFLAVPPWIVRLMSGRSFTVATRRMQEAGFEVLLP